MIPRYTLPEMANIFSDTARFDRYLEIELLATEAHAALGVVPADDARTCRAKSPIVDEAFVEAVSAREAVTDHDVAAFVDVVQAAIGAPAGAWIHYGLTSSDVVDTAWCWMMRDACDLLIAASTELLRTLVLLADPHSFPTDAFLRQMAHDSPATTVVGGLASAARTPGGNRLVLDGLLLDDGAVGFLLEDASARVVVSQGCRPIGEPFIVTRSDHNFIHELGGRPALERVQQLIDGASPADRSLLAQGLHAGIVIDERKAQFTRGDFLVRNVLGANRESGAVAVGDLVEAGTTVQFQVRDAATADEDLKAMLQGPSAASALVFTCNGRGSHLFGEPDHDATLVSEFVRGGAVAGMFCAGEIGPVGGRTFLHGFTASVLLFD